ncbi:hypothetical protein CEXT_391321 [Caerostris extrusa]|uniref:Uncharacterized protein n=1 Tax=Caerostris extrusa TaxID=172846 RepID=A0AAV4NTX9_CAEEX|nr:hypothetical protein CEXT_391321 [Caerostris extrusa]
MLYPFIDRSYSLAFCSLSLSIAYFLCDYLRKLSLFTTHSSHFLSTLSFTTYFICSTLHESLFNTPSLLAFLPPSLPFLPFRKDCDRERLDKDCVTEFRSLYHFTAHLICDYFSKTVYSHPLWFTPK